MLIIFFFFGDHGVSRLYSVKKEKTKLLQDIDSLRVEHENLVVERERLDNDLDYIEKLARERHRMAKPGEKLFRVVEKEN